MEENQNHPLMKHIRNNNDLEIGLTELCKLAPIFTPIVDILPNIPLRSRPPGFEGLAEIITAQQVSKASATAIFGRLKKLINPMDAEVFLQRGEAPLIEAGLSRAKQATLTGLANAIVSENLNLEHLCLLPIEEAMDKMVSLKGIGPWTSEVFLLFCAGHADVFPAGDVALQHAVGEIYSLPEKPDIKLTRNLAGAWSPFRGVAARVLYAYYSHMRQRTELPV